MLSLTTAVVSNGYRWWDRRELGPRLFVFGGALLLGTLVAAAAGNEMSGAWPAFVIGAGAPSTIRGLLSGIQVGPKHEIAASPDSKAEVGVARLAEEGSGENVH